MEILDNYHIEREGNDCLIIDSIALIRISYSFYIVIHTIQVVGGWTGNPIETNYENFSSYENAREYYNELCTQLKE